MLPRMGMDTKGTITKRVGVSTIERYAWHARLQNTLAEKNGAVPKAENKDRGGN